MIKEFEERISLVMDLSVNDFKNKYTESILGYGWAFIQPLVTTVVYLIVFQYGLRVGNDDPEIPYVLWFMSGMVPWLFFADCLGCGLHCYKEYSFLVKKVAFPVRILPAVKVASALYIHVVFLIFLFGLSMFYGTAQNTHFALLIYYGILLVLYAYGAVMLASCLAVFFRDIVQLVQVFLQVGMWATPVLWNYQLVAPGYRWIMDLNPMFYITEGYRQAFLGRGASPDALQRGLFFLIWGGLLLLSAILFRRLHIHFADLL